MVVRRFALGAGGFFDDANGRGRFGCIVEDRFIKNRGINLERWSGGAKVPNRLEGDGERGRKSFRAIIDRSTDTEDGIQNT